MKNSSISSSKGPHLPRGALVALGIVAILEITVYLFMPARDHPFLPSDRPPSVEESVVYFKAEHITRLSEPPDILFLGDSACLMNVIPAVIEAQTGLTAYNLGTIEWLMPPGHLALFKRFLEHQPAPQLLVYVISPLSVREDHTHYGFYDHFKQAYLPDSQAKTVFVWPSWQLRDELLSYVDTANQRFRLATPRGRFASHIEMGSILWQQQGYLPDPSEPAIIREPAWPGPAPSLDINPAWREGLERLIDFARDKDISLYLYFSPLPFADSPTSAGDSALLTWLDTIQQSNPSSIRVARPVILSYPPGMFTNELHLTPRGAEIFSTRLAKEIRP